MQHNPIILARLAAMTPEQQADYDRIIADILAAQSQNPNPQQQQPVNPAPPPLNPHQYAMGLRETLSQQFVEQARQIAYVDPQQMVARIADMTMNATALMVSRQPYSQPPELI
jgi:hypothetical protein